MAKLDVIFVLLVLVAASPTKGFDDPTLPGLTDAEGHHGRAATWFL